MIKPEDLDGDARRLYESWRSLGLSESTVMESLRRDGWIPTNDHDRLVRTFREVFGLSEEAAEAAACGRGGPSVRRVSEVAGRSAARPEPGDAWKLVAKIEEFASDLCRRGVSEKKALREAAFTVFRAMHSDQAQEWVAKLIDLRWPGLLTGGLSGSARTGGTVHG